MLVLVAGATGHLGQQLIDSLASRGHRVRALGRNPSKLEASQLAKLESFVQSETYYDIAALDRACAGVDAVICAYFGLPELQLEGNLLLLRAAERAGVTKFVASTWNCDWSKMELGQHENYDPLIALRRQVELAFDIKPIYIMSGVLAEVLFCLPGRGDFVPANNGMWDPARKALEIWGSGNEVWHWTTERDAAEFAAAIVSHDDASQGGVWRVCSGSNSLRELAATYEAVREVKVDIQTKGPVEKLRDVALQARKAGSLRGFWGYIGLFYQLYVADGTWGQMELDNDRLDVRVTSFAEFLGSNPEV
ncbi:NAD(P)-binding protein [Auricularia subglabra TFB-10046 SS5]|uniref:NAD(P)-binding protein n=1 Tax=Auricularia subglabra (strain TFB-10046 / SS5) TaxID=717982 RepID=J0WX88_AURST|nr:NAD(P)-binding protein [Auricularia subglabra TFB-10046 SS5]